MIRNYKGEAGMGIRTPGTAFLVRNAVAFSSAFEQVFALKLSWPGADGSEHERE